MSLEVQAVNAVVVGIGLHGLELCNQLVSLGYNLIGAVDPGPKAGTALRGHLNVELSPNVFVVRDSEELFTNIAANTIDIAVLAPALDGPSVAAIAADYMLRGINVITLNQDLFGPSGEWVQKLQDIGARTGASFLATGVQDGWYVHLPNLIAASTLGLQEVRYSSVVDLNSLSEEVGKEIGVGLSPDQFEQHAQLMMSYPPVLGEPLKEAARKMGHVPGPIQREIRAVLDDKPRLWSSSKEEIPAQHAIGMVETTSSVTNKGVTFVGSISARLLSPGECASDNLVIIGSPDIHIEITPFPGGPITNVALLNRISDVLEHAGGVMFSAEINSPQYRY